MRIFLDANILFSAAKSDGAIRRLVALLQTTGHECWVDGFVEAEAKRNLEAKFPSALADLDILLSGLTRAKGGASPSLLETAGRLLPEKDRPVLAAAIALGCDALVTGDKTHFGALYGKTFSGVTVFSPAALAAKVL